MEFALEKERHLSLQIQVCSLAGESLTVKRTTRARKYAENKSSYSWPKYFFPCEALCWALPAAGPFFFLPSTSPSSRTLTDVLTVSVYGPEQNARYSKIHKAQFLSLWRALPNGEDSRILQGTETSSVPEDETYPSSSGEGGGKQGWLPGGGGLQAVLSGWVGRC